MSQRLHIIAQVAAAVGAIGAVALTLYAGRGNGLPFLMILMAGWVFAPFFGFALASRFTGRWTSRARIGLDITIVVIAIAAIVLYARDAFGPPHAKQAAVYVAVPIASWVLLIIALAAGAVASRQKSGST